ncbi:MAG: autotransporter-associated beta strand repeat-containing protein, partial [Pirellulales bacterium]
GSPVAGQTLALPEAEGVGRFATGARTNLASASVYRVTNLNDSGAGSFRDAVSQSNRFVVFDVGGVVTLNSVAVVSSNVTIAGQTAPGGIAFYGDRVAFTSANNTISRYFAVRKGEAGTRADSVSLARGTNMIFDHMSVTWGVDETFSMNPDSGYVIDNITIQNTVIAQGLDRLGHSAGGLMTLGQGSRFSIIKNLFADNVTRNPKVRGENEFINNVVYGYETAGYIMGDTVNMTSHANAIGNYFIEGPVDGSSPFASGTPQFEIYGSDNWVDTNRNGLLDGSRITTYPGATVASTPFAFPTTASMTAQEAVAHVMENAGVTITRDEVDTRIMQEVASYGTLGGVIQYDTDLFPTFSAPRTAFGRLADADADGMPDNWEQARGLNPASNSDWKTLTGPYTNLELYLNELGANEVSARWVAATGTWGTAANWSGSIPTFATDAVVSGSVAVTGGNAFTRRLSIGGTGGGSPQGMAVNGGTLDVFERLHVGEVSNATLSLTAGSVAAGELVLGGQSGSTAYTGTLVMSGGTLQAAFIRPGSVGGAFVWSGGVLQCTANPTLSVATTLGVAGGSITTNGFSGTWSGVISGSGGLTKNGTGTLTLSNSNTMTGGVRVNAGTIGINQAAAAGTGPLTLAGGNVSFGSASGVTTPFIVLANGTISAGGITLNGSISGSAGRTVSIATTTTGNLTLSGSLSGFAGTLNFGPSTGNIRLNGFGANGSTVATFDLGTSTAAIRTAFGATVSMGSVTGGTATRLQGATNTADTVTYVIGGNGQSTTFSGSVTDGVYSTPGVTNLTKTGAGTLTLGGAASTYSGVTRVSAGTLSVATLANGGTASGIGQSSADPANLILDGGALLYTGPAVTVDRGFTVTANGGRFERNGSGTLALGSTSDIVMADPGDRVFTLAGNSTSYNNFFGGLGDPTTGITTFPKDWTGTWRLFGAAKTYSGNTVVNGGSLFLVTAGVLPT